MGKHVRASGKVYFMQWHFDVKLQADKHVRRDVAERLNHKQMKTLGEKTKWPINTWQMNGQSPKTPLLKN